MDLRPRILLSVAVFWTVGGALSGCAQTDTTASAIADAGPGTVVATFPPNVIALGLAGDERLLRVVGLHEDADGGIQLFVFRVSGGAVAPEQLPPNLDWSDYTSGGGDYLASHFDTLPGAAYLLGVYGVTVVPFDGSPSRWFFRPELLPDGGPVTDPDGGLIPGPLSEAFQLEADGSTLVAYWDSLRDHSCSIGRYSPSGEWQELVALGEPCKYGTILLADPANLYVTTMSSLLRIERASGAPTVLLSGLAWLGRNAIFQLAESKGSLVFHRFVGSGAELDRLEPDGGIQLLATYGGSDPVLNALATDGASIYELSQLRLRRWDPDDHVDVLAQAGADAVFGVPGFGDTRLIFGDAGVYLTHTVRTASGLGTTLRRVPR